LIRAGEFAATVLLCQLSYMPCEGQGRTRTCDPFEGTLAFATGDGGVLFRRDDLQVILLVVVNFLSLGETDLAIHVFGADDPGDVSMSFRLGTRLSL
jgi:hypothetical protein